MNPGAMVAVPEIVAFVTNRRNRAGWPKRTFEGEYQEDI